MCVLVTVHVCVLLGVVTVHVCVKCTCMCVLGVVTVHVCVDCSGQQIQT